VLLGQEDLLVLINALVVIHAWLGVRSFRAKAHLQPRCVRYELELVLYKLSASGLVAMRVGAEAWRIWVWRGQEPRRLVVEKVRWVGAVRRPSGSFGFASG
jgi:hypothetical protein